MLDGDHRLTEAHRVPDAKLDRSADSLTAGKKGAVGRSEILEHQLAGLKPKLGMTTRDLGIEERDVTDVAADDDRLLVERFRFWGAACVLNVQGVERHRES